MNRIIKIILHLFYWMVFCLFSGIVSFRMANGYGFIAQNILSFLYNLGWAAIQFYLFYFFIYRYIEQQKYVTYFIFSVIIPILLSGILILVYQKLFDIHLNFKLMEFLPPMAGTFIIGHTGSLVRGFIRWFEDIQHKQEVEKILLRNELDMLNAQLNPHFLFNTLNNIDTLIRSNPDKASESLITLSEIMRYMLYDAKKPKVLIGNEIVHYRNIIKLQQLRLKDPSKVIFTTELTNERVEIAPLLFLPFIENAFKYAIFDREDTSIKMDLRSTEGKIVFSCGNYYHKEDQAVKHKTGGIGLTNLKRRLELLYDSRYSLQINDENGYFSVELIIEL